MTKSNRMISALVLLLLAPSALSSTVDDKNPLAPLTFLIGGVWIGDYQLPDGQRVRQERVYEWEFNRQLITGRTFVTGSDERKQVRQTTFVWNVDSKTIEFHDYDDRGYTKGSVSPTGPDSLYIEATGVTGPHMDWRGDLIREGNRLVFNVEVLKDGEWIGAGEFTLRRQDQEDNESMSDSQFLYKLKPARQEMLLAGPTEQEAQAISAHVNYLKQLTEQGTVLLAGRTLNTDESGFGIVIIHAASEPEARELMEDDPAVKSGTMTATLFPYQVAMTSLQNHPLE